MKTQQKGFTLIELMIVIAIIGILASVALPAYREYIVNSKMASTVVSVTGIQRAIEKEHSRKGNGIFTSTKNPLVGDTDAVFVKALGMRGLPQNPEGVSKIELVKAAKSVAGTCVSSTNYKADGAIVEPVTGANGGAIMLTLNDGIDLSFDKKTITFVPAVTKTGMQWRASSTLDSSVSGGDIAELACRWLSENINGKDGAS